MVSNSKPMAYRRREGIYKASPVNKDIHRSPNEDDTTTTTTTSLTAALSSSLVTHAIRASVAQRESSLSSAYS
ncbi:hypothetical protein L1987_62029 [Smallanthus sonchifolius]|uniref:Uncharacterized protein n=1 Tax=Smallanthus sonchifolius TaxID=185202 RepID=A0ACB9C9G0_9ASTR|nr:hypothetical protein L1987_62029 [Smallanthus sonchifolius]